MNNWMNKLIIAILIVKIRCYDCNLDKLLRIMFIHVTSFHKVLKHGCLVGCIIMWWLATWTFN